MEARFWHGKWAKNEIGFHEKEANPLLVDHLQSLSLPDGARVFVPLCGKSLDMHWLLAQGHRVVGVELSRLAVEQLFEELGAKPTVTRIGWLDRYAAPGIEVYVGDLFHLSADLVGVVDAIYDRAALVALPAEMRGDYARHLIEISLRAPQLLICFEYEPHLMAGPPFPVFSDEVLAHYQQDYEVDLRASVPIPGGFKGRIPATESVWLLRPIGSSAAAS